MRHDREPIHDARQALQSLTKQTVNGRRVGILGLGVSGVGAAQLLLSSMAEAQMRPASLMLIDDAFSEPSKRSEVCQALGLASNSENALRTKDISIQTLTFSEATTSASEFAIESFVVSPGLPRRLVESMSTCYEQAKLVKELELAHALINPHDVCIGITGTNGKSTLTHMTRHLLAESIEAYAVGNIGDAWSAVVAQQGKSRKARAWVVEMSSYQLEGGCDLQLDAGMILPMADDHLTRHQNAKNYVAAKCQMVPLVYSLEKLILPEVSNTYFWSARSSTFARTYRSCAFVPEQKARAQVITQKDANWKRAFQLVRKVQGPWAEAQSEAEIHFDKRIEGFRGLPFRCEEILSWPVRVVNDSKATNVHSTCFALMTESNRIRRQSTEKISGAREVHGRLHLLLGGAAKKESFAPLWQHVKAQDTWVYLFGADGPRIAESARTHGCPYVVFDSMEEATMAALESTRHGDVVLLSPACASFDAYENFSERGQVFSSLVRMCYAK